MLHQNDYSHHSNSRGGWNKRGVWIFFQIRKRGFTFIREMRVDRIAAFN